MERLETVLQQTLSYWLPHSCYLTSANTTCQHSWKPVVDEMEIN